MKRENFKKTIVQPQQSRGKQTVRYILTAAEILLKESGLKDFTTNKIAEKAGFSVASLYQFFPNKETIFKQIVDKVFAERLQKIKDLLQEDIGRIGVTFEQTLEKLSNFIIVNDFSQDSIIPLLYYHAVKLDLEKEIDERENLYINELVDAISKLEEKIEAELIRDKIILLAASLRGLFYQTLNTQIIFHKGNFRNEIRSLIFHFLQEDHVKK